MTRKLRKTAVGIVRPARGGGSVELHGRQLRRGRPEPIPAGQAAQPEESCISGVDNAPWYATVAPYEHASIQRTTVFACAAFHGSMDGPNVVQAGAPVGGYTTPFNLSTRRPDEMYLYGGGTGNATPPALQTYVAKLEPGTAKQIWRTTLSDATQNNELHLSGAVDVMANGDLVAISDHTLYKLSGDTGEILAKNDMPTGKAHRTTVRSTALTPSPTARSSRDPEPAPGCTKNGYPAAASPPPLGVRGRPGRRLGRSSRL